MKISYKKLSDTAIAPERAHVTDAAYDLFADEDVIIPYGKTKVVPTNIAIELPFGYYADIRPRSGKTLNSTLRIHLGTIDSGFRDGLGIICENGSHARAWHILSNIQRFINGFRSNDLTFIEESRIAFNKDTAIHIKKGEKIAQLLIQKLPEIELAEVNELTDSDRGTNGFGSTDRLTK